MGKAKDNPFKKYLDDANETPWSFSRRSGISQPTIYRIYKGGRAYRKSALAICNVTGWKLKLQDFGY